MGVVRVWSARSGRLGRGMPSGDGGGSARHAGGAQGGNGEKSGFMHRPALCVSPLISEQGLVLDVHVEVDQVELDQPSSTLQMRRDGVGERR